MKLIVGLGNPGSQYALTRHNIGFMIIDNLASKYGISLSDKKKCLLGEGFIDNERVVLVKPQTFMNLSGEAVKPVFSSRNVDLEDLIIIHDDIDLEFARIKIKVGGGHGGHNGIRSIASHLGSRDFARVRVGIGRSVHGEDVSNYVLSPFSKDEKVELDTLMERTTKAVEAVVNEGALTAMNNFN